ncbi:hypothetical protein [Ideonella oryzae]|uniref:Uncharacterized protein n=1 Tax=Ideonella oryzae TaxID=2937441 RepID=A0ABT1BJ17_9BURK|nr:hypothetical protein [Ideonella oryzae]MCO5975592.1 hypothetical protein [Ideonella oryzae]
MKSHTLVVAALALMGLGVSLTAGAQPAPMASAPGASAPGMGTGMGMGPGKGARMGPGAQRGGMYGPKYTPGWSVMTDAERAEHRTRMQSFTNRADCQAYVTEHHAQMAERMKQQGGQPMPQPRRDPCATLKP